MKNRIIRERSDSTNGAKRLHFWSEATLFGGVRGGVSPPGLPPFPRSLYFLILGVVSCPSTSQSMLRRCLRGEPEIDHEVRDIIFLIREIKRAGDPKQRLLKGTLGALLKGNIWKNIENMKNEKMHKSVREQSSEFNNWRKWILKWFWSFWEALYFFNFWSTFLIFWPALRHQGWCQNITQRSLKLFGKTSFLTLHTFSEQFQKMSKKYILSYHIMSYNITSYNIIS